MPKFLVILNDNESGKVNWQYPSELMGKTKQEVYNLIAQDVPAETIHEILSENEYYNKYIKKIEQRQSGNDQSIQQNIEDISSDQFENGNDFFNTVVNTVMQQDNNNTNNNTNNKPEQNDKIELSNNIQQVNQLQNNISIKYFEEGGIKFKLENGVLFKKVWKQVLLNGQKTPSGDEAVSEFRLVSSSTKKLVSVDKVELQRLEWEEVKTH